MGRMGLADAPRSGKGLATVNCYGRRLIMKSEFRANRFHRGLPQTARPQSTFDFFMKRESG